MHVKNRLVWLILVALVVTSRAYADVVQMQNGDVYNGKVLSLGESSLILQNEVLGRITLPREKIASVVFREQLQASNVALLGTNQTVLAQTNRPGKGPLSQLAGSGDLIKKIEDQYLLGADAAAHQKFNDLVSGLISGSVTMDDLRREAKTAAEQARALKKDAGPDAAFVIDGYLSILDQFLREVPDASAVSNNPAAQSAKQPIKAAPKKASADDD